MSRLSANPDRFVNFISYATAQTAVGLIEASLRTDHVNGTGSSPVAFIEGIYVVPEYRRRGVARALLACVEEWAQANGCTELASDASLDNTVSHAMHRATGFDETERVVFFRKPLGAEPS